ncbi:hypothetical protein ACQP1W_25315 [Spirillospora sp. CA-255316]
MITLFRRAGDGLLSLLVPTVRASAACQITCWTEARCVGGRAWTRRCCRDYLCDVQCRPWQPTQVIC